MLEKYQKYFMLNKNLLIAFTASIIISTIVAHLLSEQADYFNTTYTLLVDSVIYFSVFGGLYYLDNRKKYLLKSGQTDKLKLKHDLIKIITSLGISEVAYMMVIAILFSKHKLRYIPCIYDVTNYIYNNLFDSN